MRVGAFQEPQLCYTLFLLLGRPHCNHLTTEANRKISPNLLPSVPSAVSQEYPSHLLCKSQGRENQKKSHAVADHRISGSSGKSGSNPDSQCSVQDGRSSFRNLQNAVNTSRASML